MRLFTFIFLMMLAQSQPASAQGTERLDQFTQTFLDACFPWALGGEEIEMVTFDGFSGPLQSSSENDGVRVYSEFPANSERFRSGMFGQVEEGHCSLSLRDEVETVTAINGVIRAISEYPVDFLEERLGPSGEGVGVSWYDREVSEGSFRFRFLIEGVTVAELVAYFDPFAIGPEVTSNPVSEDFILTVRRLAGGE